MKKILASFVTIVLVVAMSLGAMFILVRATDFVTAIPSRLERAGAIVAELLLDVLLLLGTVWLATHLAVRIFATKTVAPSSGPRRPQSKQPSETEGAPLA